MQLGISRDMTVCLIAVFMAAIGVTSATAQAELLQEIEGLPLKAERKIEFTTDEGTWMSLDVSRDGRTILFELLGDLYTAPINGGAAKIVRAGGRVCVGSHGAMQLAMPRTWGVSRSVSLRT